MDGMDVLNRIHRELRALRSLAEAVDKVLASGSLENARRAATESTVRRKAFTTVMSSPHDRDETEAIA
jgi:hypothetical protein